MCARVSVCVRVCMCMRGVRESVCMFVCQCARARMCCILSTSCFHKSTLVARGANTQLDPSCVSAPPATNLDLFAWFAERLFY